MAHMSRALVLFAFLTSASLAYAESAGGVSWKSPAGWKLDAERPMRVATYKIAPVAGDADEAELAIFFFGAGQGGSVEDNLARWAGQFEGAKPPAKKQQKVAGLVVTRIEIEGSYTASMGPMGPVQQKTAKPGYKLLGAIVEGGEGPVFFKLTGSKKTVEAARGRLEKLLRTLSK